MDRALTDHELVKVRARVGDRDLRDEMLAELATATRAEVVQRIGHVALVLPAPSDQAEDHAAGLTPISRSRSRRSSIWMPVRRSGPHHDFERALCRPAPRLRLRRPRSCPTSARAIGDEIEIEAEAHVGLGFADDLEDHLFAGLVLEVHRGAEHDLVGLGSQRDVDDLAVRQVVLEFLDAAFAERLLLARGVVFGVFAQVAVRAGLGDGLDDAWPLDALEAFQLDPGGALHPLQSMAYGSYPNFLVKILQAVDLDLAEVVDGFAGRQSHRPRVV